MSQVWDCLGRRRLRVQGYVAVVATFALCLAMGLAIVGFGSGNVLVVALLGAVAAYSERVRIRLDRFLDESISLVPILFAALLFGPLAAMLVSAASLLPDLVAPPSDVPEPRLRWLTYTSSRSINAAAIALLASLVASHIANDFVSIVAAATAAAITAQALDAGFAAVTARVRGVATMRHVLRALLPLGAASVPLYAPIVAFLVFAYQQISPLTLPLFLVPALAAQRLFVMYRNQSELTAELLAANQALERVNVSFATALVATLDARDRYTAGHSAAVAVYARDIAARLSLSEHQQNLAHLAGLVHDIGKIGLPAGLLEKAGALTLEERRKMEQHPVIGERILANVDTYREVAAIVRHHHERFDGNGYPDRLEGEAIPLLARIITVADAYDAMTSDRPYRDAMPSRVARLRLAQAVGSQFDTSIVAAFEAILANLPEQYRLGQHHTLSLSDSVAETEDVATVMPLLSAAQASL